jgi:hypothetical protein
MGVPPSKWGPYFWGVIHLGCLAGSMTSEFITMYPSVIPCGACGQHFAELIQELPFPDSQDPMVLFEWSVDAHNRVNSRIGKPIITAGQALAIWTQDTPPIKSSQFDIKIAIIVILLLLLLYMFYVR